MPKIVLFEVKLKDTLCLFIVEYSENLAFIHMRFYMFPPQLHSSSKWTSSRLVVQFFSVLAMATASFFLIVSCFSSSIFIPPSTAHNDINSTTSDGFVVDLIHHDSPSSPFYDHNMTSTDRSIWAADRSIARLNYLLSVTSSSSSLGDISSKLVPEYYEYIMMYYLGVPSTLVYGIADTGSELIWLQCLPCTHCYNQTPPIFDPAESYTYETVSSDSPICNAVRRISCREGDKSCCYQHTYGDGTTTKGTLSTDVFAFEDPTRTIVEVGYLTFGCSHDTKARLKGHQAGVVGLNRHPNSLVSQLKVKKFSYCMVIPDDHGSGSRMYFGSRAVILGGKTPLLKGDYSHYFVTLKGISVGEEKVPLPEGIFNINSTGTGGFIIDSGTTYTVLRSEAYNSLVNTLSNAIHLPWRKYRRFGICFEGRSDELASAGPDITFHFYGADFILTKQTTYVEVEKGLWCLAMLSSNSTRKLSILGNIQQQNYHVGYDLEAQVVSFAPVDCATF